MCAIAFVDKETFLRQEDPHERQQEYPHERQHVERRRLLEQKVVETLALKPSKPSPLLKKTSRLFLASVPAEDINSKLLCHLDFQDRTIIDKIGESGIDLLNLNWSTPIAAAGKVLEDIGRGLGSEHGTYKLSPDEEKREIRDYLKRSRQVRIMQVRAQEMLLAAQRVEEFRQRKRNEKRKLLQVLKEAWQEEHNKRIADVEEDLMTSCNGIGQSHNAAQEVTKILAAMGEEKAKQAEESRLWETLRYHKAKEEECARISEAVDADKLGAKDRNRVVACAAEIERTRARFFASRVKFKSMEDKPQAPNEDPAKYIHLDFNSIDIKRNFIQSRLAGTPNDYKDTYFHSRFCVLKDKTNLNNTQGVHGGVHHEEHNAERNAWEAAEVHLKSVELEQQQKAEQEELWNKRKLERGQAAAAQLQKIASLEEELAKELEQEQERKNQLQLIEELSREAQVSTYKTEQKGHLDFSLHVNKVIEEHDAPVNEQTSDINAPDCCETLHEDASQPVGLETNKPTRQRKKEVGTADNNIAQQSKPARDAGIYSRQSTQDVNMENGNRDAKDDESLDSKDTEIVDVRISVPESPRKPSTPTKMLNSGSSTMRNHFSPPKNLSGPEHLRAFGKEGRNRHSPQSRGPTECNLPSRPLNVKHPRLLTKAQKCVDSTPQVSPLPSLIASNNIRKGNKSPQRLQSPGMAASNGHGTVEHFQEVGKRSRCRQPLAGTKALEKRSTLPALAQKLETFPAEGRKMTPRKHGSTWLTNVLEKLTWWKSNKGLLISGVFTPQTTPPSESHPSLGGHRPKLSNKIIRKEHTPKFPAKQVDSPAKFRPLNKSLSPRSKNLENTESLAPSELQVDDRPGWYEAYTKDVFSAEELEALQLELYGTWTDGNASTHSRAKPKRAKSRTGQQEHDSRIVNLQWNEESKVLSRSRSNEKVSDNSGNDRITKDPEVQITGGQLDIEQVRGAKSSAGFLNKPPVEEVALSNEHCSLSCGPLGSRHVAPEQQKGFVTELRSSPVSQGSQRPYFQSEVEIRSSNSDKVRPKPDERGASGQPTSARDVAEKLIHAWQTGLLGGASSPVSEHGKHTSVQTSRKRRGHTVQSNPDCGNPGIGSKAGWRTNITRATENSAANDVTLETPFVSSRSSVPNANSFIKSQEKNKSVRDPMESKIEPSKNNTMDDSKLETRSLDFILGSLSAQVKELDERLSNLTSCTIYSSFPDKQCRDGENQDCETVSNHAIEQEKLSSIAPSVKSQRIGDKIFNADEPKHLWPQTGPCYRSGYRQPSSKQGQSPMSSMASCLENISDLMQEMSRSAGYENIAPQITQKSFTGSIPKNPETNLESGKNVPELVDQGYEQDLLTHGRAKNCIEMTSRISLKSSAELRSGIIQRNEDPRCLLPFERGSLSSINLEEAMSLDEIEEQLLLSGSVDFSPWNTEKLPDVFSSIAHVAMSMKSTGEHDSNHGEEDDVDCEGTLRPVYCHVRKESEWLLRGNKLKVKSKAYEKKRASKAKGKVKRSPKKPFNPVAKPPRHSTPRKKSSPIRNATAAVMAKVGTTRIQPTVPLPGAVKFQRKEFRLANDGASKMNLTTRSLPALIPGSVTAEEVQKWLCREAAVSYPATWSGGTPSKKAAPLVRRHCASYKRPDSSESSTGGPAKLLANSPVRIPDFGLRESTWRKKVTQPVVHSARRPASAGTVLKR